LFFLPCFTSHSICGTLNIDAFVNHKQIRARSHALWIPILSVLREEIVPRLERDAPGQPDSGSLEADPLRSRFTLVFDREGYSPSFFAEMKTRHIAILSYHKFPGEPSPQSEFRTHKVTLVHGEEVDMELAERGICLSNAMWCARSGSARRAAHKAPFSALITAAKPLARQPACSHVGVRKTSSNSCANTTILTA